MDSIITFEGPGPFHLPTAQRGTAVGHENNGVTLIIKAQLRQDRRLDALNIQMTAQVARELAASLVRTANQSEGLKE
jgi:hypothetical protein